MTFAVPPSAMSLAGIAAVNRVALTIVVVRLIPFHRTTELEMNEDPSTVNVKPASPAVAFDGEMEVMLGTGFWGVGVPPPPPPPQQLASAREVSATTTVPRPNRARVHFVFEKITIGSL